MYRTMCVVDARLKSAIAMGYFANIFWSVPHRLLHRKEAAYVPEFIGGPSFPGLMPLGFMMKPGIDMSKKPKKDVNGMLRCMETCLQQ